MSSVELPTKPGSSMSYGPAGGMVVKMRDRKGNDGCEMCSTAGRFFVRLAGYDFLTERVVVAPRPAQYCGKHAAELAQIYVSAIEGIQPTGEGDNEHHSEGG
jgi:hypothetical protein